jgi:Family of unknown function (DUF6325)
MAVGPVEYMIVVFPGNRFTGEIAPELARLVDSETVRLLDLVFITKDADGGVVAIEFDETDELESFSTIEGEVGGLIAAEDIEHAGSMLEPNSSAALLVWEDLWAAPLAEAIRGSGGFVIEGSRIPHELMEQALAGSN